MTEDRYLSVDSFRSQFIPMLGRDTAYREIKNGNIRAVRQGRRLLVPQSEVTGYLRRRLEAVGAS